MAEFFFVNNFLSHSLPPRDSKKGRHRPPRVDCADPERGPQPKYGA